MSEERTVRALVEEMTSVLASSLGGSAKGEAREILALQLDKPRHWATTAFDSVVSAHDCDRAVVAAHRRADGAPLQYAAGRAAFRHLLLDVDDRVLIPRPETEVLVDIVLERTRGEGGGIAVDVGTGSGAIALALACEGRFSQVIGTDVSLDALAVARSNTGRVTGDCAALDWRHGSLLTPVPERALRAVVSNPPYISFEEAESLPSSVRNWEPPVALFSGDAGMGATRQLIDEAGVALAVGGLLALEVDSRRAIRVADTVSHHGAYEDVRVLRDLTGRDRFVVARRRENDE